MWTHPDEPRYRPYIDSHIRYRLKAYRKRCFLNHQDVADGTGLSKSTVCAIENGGKKLAVTELVILCDFYGLYMEDLLDIKRLHDPIAT